MARTATCNCGECRKCKRRTYMREYLRKHADANRQRVLKYRAEHLEIVRAKDRARGFRIYDQAKVAARRATRVLDRQPCEECGEFPAHAHHEDYSQPLDVRWLCPGCHGIEHRTY